MLFHRILIRELTRNALAVLLVLLTVMLTIEFVRLLGQAAVGAKTLEAVLIMMGFHLVQVLPIFLSLTIFIAVLMVFIRAWRDHEMPIWGAAGLSLLSWTRPVLAFVLPGALVIVLVSFFMSPWATQQARDYQQQIQQREDLGVGPLGVFQEAGHRNTVYFVGTQVEGKSAQIFVETRAKDKVAVMTAAAGYQQIEANGRKVLVLTAGERHDKDTKSGEFSMLTFDQYQLVLAEKSGGSVVDDLAGMSSLQLWSDKTDAGRAEWQWRLALPLAALMLGLCAVPLAGFNPRSSRGYNLLAAVLVYLVYFNLLGVARGLMVRGAWPVAWGLWPIHILAGLLLLAMVSRQMGWFRLELGGRR